jgi:hypothetical protein
MDRLHHTLHRAPRERHVSSMTAIAFRGAREASELVHHLQAKKENCNQHVGAHNGRKRFLYYDNYHQQISPLAETELNLATR